MNSSSSQEFHNSLLHPLKGVARNKHAVFGFDVETEHIRKDFKRKNGSTTKCWQQNFVMGSIVGKNYEETFWKKDDMCKALLSRKFRGAHLMATNLEFDFNQLFHDSLSKFRFVYRHGLLATMYRDEKNKRKRNWLFTDSTNYLKCSVEKLGEIVGEYKLPKPAVMESNPEILGILARRPKNPKEKEELKQYNLQDSRITYLFAESFKDFCTKHNMKMKLTIGSTGMDYWRRNHQQTPFTREPDVMLRKHFLGAFRGGMTQTFKRGTYEGKVYAYDYRSSYPGVMLEGVDGKGSYPHPSCFVHRDKSNTDLIEEYEGICFAKVKAPYSYIPILGVKVNQKLLFPYGTFEGWFTNYELRMAMKQGYEVWPGEMIYYHTLFKPFVDAVKSLYRIRQTYKKEGHPYEAMVKTLMNGGLFGKWGTNFMNMEELIASNEITFDTQGRAVKDGKVLDEFSMSNESMLISIKKEVKPMRYSFPILSSYTTMLGRMKLLRDIKPYAKLLLYSDTDCAHMTKPCFKEGSELGDWDLQYISDGATYIKSKLYKTNPIGSDSICKSKGVGKFMNKPDTFFRAIDTGRVLMERFSRMKESDRIGIKSGSIIQLHKHLGLDDDKRDWNGLSFDIDGWQDSEPLKLTCGLTPQDQQKALTKDLMGLHKKKMDFINSDLFDRHSVGSDISNEEFLKNEQWFALNE